MTAPVSTIREYEIRARSTDIFGRVLMSAREHHFIVDGPVQNGCPGEEVTPPELLLSAVLSCGVELVQVIAKETNVAISGVKARALGMLDRSKQPRADVTLFNEITLEFDIAGTTLQNAQALVAAFQKRCPIFGTVFVATQKTTVVVRATA